MRASDITLTEADFSTRWRKTALGRRVLAGTHGYRVIGAVGADSPEGPVQGVLVRRVADKRYRLITDAGEVTLPLEPTEAFLRGLRHFHGGPGRTQGTLASDGVLYPIRCAVTLTDDCVAYIAGADEASMSAGLRQIAQRVRERVERRYGRLDDLRELYPGVTNTTGWDGPVDLVRVYLDEASVETLRRLGGGQLSRGIRFAVWVLQHGLRGDRTVRKPPSATQRRS